MDPLTIEESRALLRRAPVGHLGVVADGRPYVTPMSFVLDPSAEAIFFRTVPGRKLEAISDNPSVCVEVSEYDETTGAWSSVIISGIASEVDEASLGAAVVSSLFEKYGEALGSPLGTGGGLQPLAGLTTVLRVDIGEMSGMSSGRLFSPRTRPGRL